MNFWKETLRFGKGVIVERVLCFFFSFIFSVACHGIVHGALHKVMCVGDSITSAYSDPSDRGGYREPLFDLLVGDGFDVEFVGQVENPIIPSTQIEDSWRWSEGHSGWHADDIGGNITTWLGTEDPDTVLLHIGTNDLYFDQQAPDLLVVEVMDIVDAIFLYNSAIDVILAQIINQGNQNPDYLPGVFDNRKETSDFNDLLLLAALGYSSYLDHLFVVDQEAPLNYPGDLLKQGTSPDYYYLHPTPEGYDKMAGTWYNGVKTAWVPIPGAVWLLGSGLIGIAGIRRKLKK